MKNYNFPETIEHTGITFTLVKKRVYVSVAVYTDGKRFMRVGDESVLKSEYSFHLLLLKHEFPVAKIIETGINNFGFYILEESLGGKELSGFFAEDFARKGCISDENFEIFLNLISRFAKAKLTTVTNKRDEEAFYIGVHAKDMSEESTEFAPMIEKAFEKIKEKTKTLPYTLTHADFNPHNMFPKGVIDFEGTFYAPAGYDLVSAIFSIFLFAKEGPDNTRKYEFSAKQIQKYFDMIDKVFLDHSLPRFSEFIDDFIICRIFFSACRMHQWPIIQKKRYDMLHRLLSDYLLNKPILDTAVHFLD